MHRRMTQEEEERSTVRASPLRAWLHKAAEMGNKLL